MYVSKEKQNRPQSSPICRPGRGNPARGYLACIRSVLPEEAKRSRLEPAAAKKKTEKKRDCVSPSLPASTSPRRVGSWLEWACGLC
ncbi:hypothetical protein GUJ93_ZPchr0003g17857 [Zizania palustris]|uniref:Uncharacterized protein n=1 Tax=Zizania palustris TaxID=103762 RepID=A0A8J5VYD5_ZIZPA|nr:hypothetical protein GUJ93_ZPchr0003g17857 [Zizania palustris]